MMKSQKRMTMTTCLNHLLRKRVMRTIAPNSNPTPRLQNISPRRPWLWRRNLPTHKRLSQSKGTPRRRHWLLPNILRSLLNVINLTLPMISCATNAGKCLHPGGHWVVTRPEYTLARASPTAGRSRGGRREWWRGSCCRWPNRSIMRCTGRMRHWTGSKSGSSRRSWRGHCLEELVMWIGMYERDIDSFYLHFILKN